MSQTFYVNLFHNGFFNFSGFKKKLENGDSGGKRPVMLPISIKLSKSLVNNAKRFPYELDTEKNIRKFGSGSFEIAFLVPTKDVKNLSETDYRNSLWFKLAGSEDERVKELEVKVDELEDKLGTKNKRIRELTSEEEEQNKGSSKSGRSSGLTCPECGSSNPRNAWEVNSGQCPSCNMVYMNDPEVVGQ